MDDVSEQYMELAAFQELRARERAIVRAHEQEELSHVRPTDFNGECPTCGAEMSQGRIAARYFNCVDCKREQELLQKLGLIGE